MTTAVGRGVRRRDRADRPTTAHLLADQLGHAVTALWRSRVVLIFTFLLPLVWLLVIGVVAGNATVAPGSDVRVMQLVTPSAAALGVVYGAFPTVAISLCEARDRGIVRRMRGTPLPLPVHLAGRIGGALVFAVGSVVAALAVGVLAYDVQIVWRTVPATVVTLVLAVACFAALGVAAAALSPSATVAQAGSIALAVVMPFLAGTFTPGAVIPDAVSRLSAVLPFTPFVELLAEQFDPSSSGGGWDLGRMAVLAAWCVTATLVAARFLRWDPVRPAGAGRPPEPHAATAHGGALVPTAARRDGADTRLPDQVVAGLRSMLRDPGAVFFTLVMPAGLYALMVGFMGTGPLSGDGPGFELTFAAGMVVWGAAVAAFMNLPEAVAAARGAGVLRRLRGTPLRPWQYLAGRTVAATCVAVAGHAVLLALATGLHGVRVEPAMVAVGLGLTVLGSSTLAACGFALAAAAPSAEAVGAVALVVLLPLSFFSDVFPVAGPPWMQAVGSVFPLRHLQHALVEAWVPGTALDPVHLLVLAAWLVGAGALATRTFRWDARDA